MRVEKRFLLLRIINQDKIKTNPQLTYNFRLI